MNILQGNVCFLANWIHQYGQGNTSIFIWCLSSELTTCRFTTLILIFKSYQTCLKLWSSMKHNPTGCCLLDWSGDAGSNIETSKSDAEAVASRITYHAEFTPSFSPDGFDLPKAYFATAQSIRDSLIINWNATYDMYERMNVKQAYYLSMEFLQVCRSDSST